jgi:RNA polymerase sigma-70 factor (ECF subfamily)
VTSASEFGRHAEAHRRELLAHCYRMLGSLHDAEDALQDALLRAWRRLDTLEEHASFRAWLYKIATNVCLDIVKRKPPRILPAAYAAAAPVGRYTPALIDEPIWLEPYPDALLDAGPPDPETVYTTRESVAFAFLAAIQYLPPRQRAALLLRDVVGWSAADVAALLETSSASVTSALQRARERLRGRLPNGGSGAFWVSPNDEAQRALLERYVRAWEEADLSALVALLRDDVVVSMPPDTLWFSGRETLASFLAATILSGEARGRVRLLPAAANRQPGFAMYQRDEHGLYVDREPACLETD